jgi:putative PIN family toxin of toxin-antitoxin system
MSEMLLNLVLDTSTLVSAFFWEGNESELLEKIEQGRAKLFTSQDILFEIEDVIRRPKFSQIMCQAGLTPDQIIQKIIALSNLVIDKELNIDVCRDKKDNKFLECAENAKADYIISGDEDLLSLKEFHGIKIVKTSKILELI